MVRVRSRCFRVFGLLAVVFSIAPRTARANDVGPNSYVRIAEAAGCRVLAVVYDLGKEQPTLTRNGVPEPVRISRPDRWGSVAVVLHTPLGNGDKVELAYGAVKGTSSVTVNSIAGCTKEKPVFADDDRDALSTPFHVGLAAEQFAPGFSDPTKDTQAIQAIFGAAAEYRIFRHKPGVWNPQIWLTGGFLAGMRSYCAADLSAAQPDPISSVGDAAAKVVCDPFNPDGVTAANVILRNATSFEVSLGLRAELLSINSGSKFPANLFVTIRDNRFAIDRATADKFIDPFVGGGFVITNGSMRGTSFQAGMGASPFYANGSKKWNRWKAEFLILATLASPPTGLPSKTNQIMNTFRFYFAVRTDFDNGPDADSVRIGTGIVFAPSTFFGHGVK